MGAGKIMRGLSH